MRFLKKRVAVVGGVLAAFTLAVGVFVGITATKSDVSAAQDLARVSYDGSWVHNWNEYSWQTHNFSLTFDGVTHKSWCGDIMANAPGSGSSWNLNRVSINNGSSLTLRRLFRAMYYGEGNDFPEFSNYNESEKILAIHFVLGKVLSNTTLGNTGNTPANVLYNKVTESDYLPNGTKDTMIYYIDPSGRGTGASYRGTQRIFTYGYEEQRSMSVDVKKVWKDHFNSDAHANVSIHVAITTADGNTPLRSDGSDYDELQDIVLNKANNWSAHFGDLMAGQQLRITEDMSASDFYKSNPNDTVYRNRAIDAEESGSSLNPTYYYDGGTVNCEAVNETSATCTVTNTEFDYSRTRIYTYKQWIDSDESKRPDVIFYTIHAFTNAGSSSVVDVTDQIAAIHDRNGDIWFGKVKVDGKNTWAGYISNLPEVLPGTDDRITYATREVGYMYADGSRTEGVPLAYEAYCGSAGEITGADNNKYCLASSRSDGNIESYMINRERTVNLQAVKTWNDGGNILNKRPDILLYEIYQNGEFYRMAGMVNPTQTGLPDTGVWTVTENLPAYDRNGYPYTYTYKEFDHVYEWWEDEENALAANYSWNDEQISYDSRDGMVNTAITSIPVIKCWLNDAPKNRPTTLGFDLYAGSTKVGRIDLDGSETNDDGCWVGSFDRLPLFDEDGSKITYTVKEDTSNVNSSYEADIAQCEVDVEARKAKAEDGEDIDFSCEFNNRWVETTDTSAASMKLYFITVPAVVLGGLYITRRAIARK